jgi:hypothetical protein
MQRPLINNQIPFAQIPIFEKMASFKPKYIIPGHGSASGLSLATNNTYHYLVFLKTKISKKGYGCKQTCETIQHYT